MPNDNTNTTTIPDEFRTFLEWKGIVVDAFSDLDVRATAFVKPATGSVGVILDRIDGKSWVQIAGKTFGTVLDMWVIGKIGNVYKATTYAQKVSKGTVQGFGVWAIGKTDYSAANYFEKAFPLAVDFYSTLYNDIVNGDGSYAHSIWEGVKTDVSYTKYYKNITFDQFMNDLGELFNPNISIPNISDGIIFKTSQTIYCFERIGKNNEDRFFTQLY